MQDLVKWSLRDENRAIQDALTQVCSSASHHCPVQVGELFSVWTEVQRDFASHVKDFQHQFDMILEGAKQLDLAKVRNLASCLCSDDGDVYCTVGVDGEVSTVELVEMVESLPWRWWSKCIVPRLSLN